MRRSSLNLLLAAGGLLAAGLFWLVPPLSAQFNLVGTIKGFKVPDYYPSMPGVATNRLKMLLTGESAKPQLDGMLLINGLRIQNYDETGSPESVIRASQCLFEMAGRNASGTGRLEMVSSDGRFSISGDGFLWRTTNSTLTISNNVRTLLNKDALIQKEPVKPIPPKSAALLP